MNTEEEGRSLRRTSRLKISRGEEAAENRRLLKIIRAHLSRALMTCTQHAAGPAADEGPALSCFVYRVRGEEARARRRGRGGEGEEARAGTHSGPGAEGERSQACRDSDVLSSASFPLVITEWSLYWEEI